MSRTFAQDTFATINRFYRWERSQEYVVRLGATSVFIDCGRRPSDWSAGEATEILRDLVQRGLLAPPIIDVAALRPGLRYRLEELAGRGGDA